MRIESRITENPATRFTSGAFLTRTDAERYLDELVVRFKGNKARDEQGERWSICEAGVVTRYAIGARIDGSVIPVPVRRVVVT